jgi:hypothetical protein
MQPHPEPNAEQRAAMQQLDRLEYKGVMSGSVSVLRHLLLFTRVEINIDWLKSASSHSLEQVPDDLLAAVASRQDDELLALAPAWAAHEEVCWTEEHARELFPLFAALCRRAVAQKKHVYLLTSGF